MTLPELLFGFLMLAVLVVALWVFD